MSGRLDTSRPAKSIRRRNLVRVGYHLSIIVRSGYILIDFIARYALFYLACEALSCMFGEAPSSGYRAHLQRVGFLVVRVMGKREGNGVSCTSEKRARVVQ